MSHEVDSASDNDVITGHADAGADSDVSASSPQEQAQEQESKHERPRRSMRYGSLVAGGLASIAIAGLALVWWQTARRDDSLASAAEATRATLRSVQDSVSALDDRIETLADAADAGRRRIDALSERLAPIPDQLAETQQRLDSLQGGSFEARARWLRAEAEYYLALANTELVLAEHWETAIAALELADDRLRAIADPGLADVRTLIADELIALRSVRLPDIDGLAFSIGRLAERVSDLPLRAELPSSYEDGTSADTSEPGLARLWSSIKGAMASLIRVERRTEQVPPALSSAERALVRRQLSVELHLARLALVERRAEAFSSSIERARQILEQDFDRSAEEIASALVLLEELGDVNAAPRKPDISGSLRALRSMTGDD
jgi:uroporphyrin-3 C-methyltransferase